MNEEIQLQDEDEMLSVCGSLDENLSFLEDELGITIIPRGNRLVLSGAPRQVRTGRDLLEDYLEVYRENNQDTSVQDFARAWMKDSRESREMAEDRILVSRSGTAVKPRTVNQKKYVEAIRNNDITFVIGPAGTGKTYLAMAMALSYLNRDRVSRIILARPAVEAGESLGFLPGDLQEKVNPYLRPLYDAIYNLMDIETCDRMLEDGTIEIAPLAFMRGRTLADSFVILDEAQNTTSAQMKMFLTRFGRNSKAVITGDITQSDLARSETSGLVQASQILPGTEGIAFIEFTEEDVVRHSIVQRIIEAYDSLDSS